LADPVTIMAGVGLGATALGAVTNAFGAASAGSAQAGMYKYQSGIALMNKQINLQNADYERYTGEVESEISDCSMNSNSPSIHEFSIRLSMGSFHMKIPFGRSKMS
jgi:GTP cyclohydrolase III